MVLRTNITPTSLVRLGKSDPNKSRPMKIKLNSENEKDDIMTLLPNLKNAEERLKRISVTEDYIVEDRQRIKKLADQAKELNRDENKDFIWRVRGSPKNGLSLVRLTRRIRPTN